MDRSKDPLIEEEKKEAPLIAEPVQKPPSPWKYFGHYIKDQKSLLTIGMVTLLGSIIVDFSLPIFIGLIINCISVDDPSKSDQACVRVNIIWLSITIAISAISGAFRGYSFNTMS